ncbi:MAG: hypothetical protein ACYDD4_10355 [Acidimicrobiales bacterium]
MSSLWTPEGEHRVTDPKGAPGPETAGPSPAPDVLDDEDAELAAQLEHLRGQLLAAPAEVVVANHAYGLFELAAMHLSQQPANIAQACLAIDALGMLVEGLAGRLGQAEASLVDALAQIRLAYVQIQASLHSPTADGLGATPE